MKFPKTYQLLLILTTMALASCSSIKTSIREPQTMVSFDKAEFDYSEQKVGETNYIKILGIPVLKNEVGETLGKLVYADLPVCGEKPTAAQSRALKEIMAANPNYDLIVYPQYKVTKKAPGMGLFYQNITIEATARLATTNAYYASEAGGVKADKTTQTSYDALALEVEKLKENFETKEAYYRRQLQDANAKAAAAVERALETNRVLPSYSSAQSASTPPLSSAHMVTTTTPVPAAAMANNDTYTLVIASYSSLVNANKALNNFNDNYASLKGKVGIAASAGKYRIGFINFNSRDAAINFKNNLIKSYPEFKDAWPYKP